MQWTFQRLLKVVPFLDKEEWNLADKISQRFSKDLEVEILSAWARPNLILHLPQVKILVHIEKKILNLEKLSQIVEKAFNPRDYPSKIEVILARNLVPAQTAAEIRKILIFRSDQEFLDWLKDFLEKEG
jgi:hypothetical protein